MVNFEILGETPPPPNPPLITSLLLLTSGAVTFQELSKLSHLLISPMSLVAPRNIKKNGRKGEATAIRNNFEKERKERKVQNK